MLSSDANITPVNGTLSNISPAKSFAPESDDFLVSTVHAQHRYMLPATSRQLTTPLPAGRIADTPRTYIDSRLQLYPEELSRLSISIL